jgi:cytochrome b
MQKLLIWDLPLRIFHWLFALTIVGAWYTSEQGSDFIEYHMLLGYFAIGLLVFRIAWGVLGPRHARFSQFMPSMSTLITYVKCIKSKQSYYSPGHNPLGSLMVVLMIVLITLQAVSGLFINDDVFSSGPYYDSVSKNVEAVMVFLHHHIFDYVIAAIVLHLIAIFYYVRIKKINIILPMITGNKLARDIDQNTDETSKEGLHDKVAIKHSKLWVAAGVILLTILFVYWLVVLNAPVVEEYYY